MDPVVWQRLIQWGVEQDLQRPPKPNEDEKLDVGMDVHSMMHDAFQGIGKHSRPLEEMMREIFMNAFIVVNDLQGGANDDLLMKKKKKKKNPWAIQVLCITTTTPMSIHMKWRI